MSQFDLASCTQAKLIRANQLTESLQIKFLDRTSPSAAFQLQLFYRYLLPIRLRFNTEQMRVLGPPQRRFPKLSIAIIGLEIPKHRPEAIVGMGRVMQRSKAKSPLKRSCEGDVKALYLVVGPTSVPTRRKYVRVLERRYSKERYGYRVERRDRFPESSFALQVDRRARDSIEIEGMRQRIDQVTKQQANKRLTRCYTWARWYLCLSISPQNPLERPRRPAILLPTNPSVPIQIFASLSHFLPRT